MSHLPECWLSEGKFDAVCMCDRLRVCEQRVLDAAREAVETLPLIVRFVKANKTKLIDQLIDRDEALAAIDALRIDTPKQQVMEHINLAVVEDA